MKKIAILGSTGSIGTQACDVIRSNPDKYKLSAVSCSKNIQKLEKQIEEFKPEIAVVQMEEDARYIEEKFPFLSVSFGEKGLLEIAASEADIIINSLVGIRGLAPSYMAVQKGKTLALANKESLVTGGQLISGIIEKTGASILPVDSEHSAIFQVLAGNDRKNIKTLYITASGGPFRNYSIEQLKNVTLADALKHPNWSMGRKITVDSATMVNKGLEVIEAYWLFGVQASQIKVLVHPQSVVHSMVEYVDNSVIAQLGTPDMRLPINYALSYPNRIESPQKPLDFLTLGSKLEFFAPDMEVFKPLKLAYDALEAGSSYTTAFNGANEALVELFLQEKIGYLDIQNTLEKVLDEHKAVKMRGIEDIFAVDIASRKKVYEIIKNI